jgi:hypothetical protein
MSLLAIEGFEGYGTTDAAAGGAAVRAQCEAKWTGKFSEAFGPRIFDGWGAGKGFNAAHSGPYNFLIMPFGEPLDEIIVGFAFKPKTKPDAIMQVMNFNDAREAFADGQGHVIVHVINGTSLHFSSQTTGTFLGSANNCLLPNRWQYIEIRVKVHATAGEVECKVNGIQVMNLSGIDTDRGGSFAEMTEVWFYAMTANADTYARAYVIDDIYIVSTDAGVHTTFLGPTKIEGLFASAEGDNIDFTPSAGTDNSANIDENPVSTTDYNSSSTATDFDLLAADNLTLLSQNIRGVQLNVDFLVTEATPFGLLPKIKTGTTEDDGDEITTADDETWVTKFHVFDQDPDTATNWTAAGINGMQIGYEVA